MLKKIICYEITSMYGESGSPLILRNHIFAINCLAGKEEETYNMGRIIDYELISILEGWR